MVWISNRSDHTIHVNITKKSGGSDEPYSIAPQALQRESTGKNLWRRSGQEIVALLREGGKEQTFDVGPSDFVRVYANAVVISQANVLIA